MHPRMYEYYERELNHLYDMAAEFAQQFPKMARGLDLQQFPCRDPYVERLLEGFAYLASRIQLKIDAEFPKFTQYLMESVYPGFLAPTPSMAVVRFSPDPNNPALADGYVIPRHKCVLRSNTAVDSQRSIYQNAHEVTLWPVMLEHAEYITSNAASTFDVPSVADSRAGIYFRFRSTAGLTFDQMKLDRLTLFLHGREDRPVRVYEQLTAHALTAFARPGDMEARWEPMNSRPAIRPVGFEDEQALLPTSDRYFSGYRLLREFFAMPQRFLFVELAGLAPAVRKATGTCLECLVMLDREEPSLINRLDKSQFSLFCTPVVNLFPKAFRVDVDHRLSEYQLTPDPWHPLDYEIHTVDSVMGFGARDRVEQEFRPFYSLARWNDRNDDLAYYAIRREPRLATERQGQTQMRARSYQGNEVYISLVDANNAPFSEELHQISMKTSCTNRDLPLIIGSTDFSQDLGAPADVVVKCLFGPTPPQACPTEGEAVWRMISQLSLNYLSLIDNDEQRGAAALRELLSLYGDTSDNAIEQQIKGIRSVRTAPIVRQLPTTGPATFGRGLEITLTCDSGAFAGLGVFLLGAVLDQFFSRYVSINSFTQTVLEVSGQGQVMRWPIRLGQHQII